jgi:hypothetical protein
MTTTTGTHKIHHMVGRQVRDGHSKVAVACITCGTRCAFTNDPEIVLAWIEAHTDGDYVVI